MTISANDAHNLSELSEQPINIDTTTLSEACQLWTDATLAANIEPEKVVSAFSPLTSLEIAVNYINGLKNALEKINKNIIRVSGDIKKAGEEQENVDTSANNNAQNGYNYSHNNNNYGGTNNNNGSNITDNNESETDNKKENIDINKVLEEIEHLPDESFIKFMEVLEALPDGKVSEYILQSDYSSELLKILLESPNVPESFKALIKDIDESLIQGVIQSILIGKGNVSEFAANVISNYMESQEGKEDLTAASETTESTEIQDKFYNNIDDMYKEVDQVLSEDDISQALLDIYDGGNDSVSSETMNLLRSAVDNLAESKNMNYSELLSGANESAIKENIASLKKSLSYFKMVNKFENELSDEIFLSYIK